MSRPMGMSDFIKYANDLEAKGNNTELPLLERIKAWSEWGRMQRDVYNMAKAHRAIIDIIDAAVIVDLNPDLG